MQKKQVRQDFADKFKKWLRADSAWRDALKNARANQILLERFRTEEQPDDLEAALQSAYELSDYDSTKRIMCQLVQKVVQAEKDQPDREQGREVSPARVQTDEEDVLVGESEDESEAAAAAPPAAAASPTVFLPDVQTDGEPKIILKDKQFFYRENKGKRIDDFHELCRFDTQLFVAAPKGDFNCLAPTPDLLSAISLKRKQIGQIFTNYYQWRERLVTSDAGNNPSVVEALDRPDILQRAQKYLDDPDSSQNTLLGALQFVCHQPTQWKAYAAKALCDALKSTLVCDSSGGWGDRLTGFMASESVQKITIIEPRTAACEAFKRQMADTGCEKVLNVLQGPAEKMMAQVDQGIDLFLTSPPYFPSERYPGHDGGQVHQTVKSTEEYLANFLLPVLHAQAERLSRTGVIALNIADVQKKKVCRPMLEAMENCTDLVFAGTVLLTLSRARYEPIYIWCRPDYYDVVRSQLGVSHVNMCGTNSRSAAPAPSGPAREGESRADTQEQAPGQEESARDDPEEPLYGGCAPFVAGKILNITPEQATAKLNACIDDAWKNICEEMQKDANSHKNFRDTGGSPDKSRFVTPGVSGFYALQILIMMLDRERVELQRERNKSKIKKGGPWVITGNLNKNFLGKKFRELDSKYEFDRSQGNDGFIDGTGYHISYVNQGMVHDNNIWVNDDAENPDYRPMEAMYLRLNAQGTPRLSKRPLLDKIYRAYRVVPKSVDIEEEPAAATAMEIDNDDTACFKEIYEDQVYLEEQSYCVDNGQGSETRVSKLPENHTVLDIGANDGTYAKWKLENGAGKIICVEPNAVSMAELKKNLAAQIADERVIVIEETPDFDRGDTLQTLIDEYLPDVIKMDMGGIEAYVLTKQYDFKNTRHLAFTYSRRSNEADRIQRYLHLCGWSTHSWDSSVFDIYETDPGNNDDPVLHCTREPMLSHIATELEKLKYTKDSGRDHLPEYNDVRNIVFGYKNRGGPGVLADTFKNKEMVELLCRYVRTVRPDFVFSSIQISYNSIYPVHIDKNNTGLSLLVTVGDFSGGGLYLDGKPMLAHNTPHMFDGNFPHGTLSLADDGPHDYYSIVCYTRKEVSKLGEDDATRLQLEDLGFNLPRHGFSIQSILSTDERETQQKDARKHYEQHWEAEWLEQDKAKQWGRRAGTVGRERKRASVNDSGQRSKRARN